MSIQPAIRRAIRSAIRQAIGDGVGGGAPATPFIATPSTATPVAGVDVTWSTNASELGTPVSYYWDFGDGTIPVTGATPAHFYTRPGPFTVTCVVTYDDDSTDTDTQVITPAQSYAKTLVNKPWQDGTVKPNVNDGSWTNAAVTVTPNFAVAPDGTTTAAKVDVGSAEAFRYMQRTESLTSGQDYAWVFYAKYVDLQYFMVNFYSNASVSVLFDIQNGTVTVAAAIAPLLGATIDPVPDAAGWYRLSVSVRVGSATCYPTLYPTTSSALAGDGSPSPTNFTGTNQTVLLWGMQLISGVDDYSPSVHYLGDVQTPAPTLTVDLPEADPYTNLIHAIVFDENYTSISYGDFDGWLGNDIYSVPVGAKPLAPVNVGWSGISKNGNWAGTWNIGIPKTSGLGFRAAGWVYFDALPAGEIRIAGLMIPNANFQAIGVDSSGNVRSQSTYGDSTLSATRITAKNWYWFGYATIGTSVKMLFKTASGNVETLYDGSAGAQLISPAEANRAFVGAYNAAGNVVNNMRVSLPTLHYIRNLDDIGYSGEVIRPQDENHIYRIDPVSGDDTADGVTTAWETVTRANAMMSLDTRGIISNAAAATTIEETGKGSWLEIDTSVQRLDVGVIGLILNTESMWVRPIAGETYVDYQAEAIVTPGDWTVTSGYTGIYETDCDVPVQTTAFGDNVCFETMGSLALLDAAAGGASFLAQYVEGATNATPIIITATNHGLSNGMLVTISGVVGNTAANGTFTIGSVAADVFTLVGSVGNGAYISDGLLTTGKLYIKTLGATDPRVDGITYAYGRIRPDYVGDTVGRPVVNYKSSDIRVTGVKTNITAVNNGGSYAVGDTTGFGGKALLEVFDCRRGDKHLICWTINTTDSEIVVRNGIADQGLSQVLTDYMGGGASFDGNIHRWENVQVINGGLLVRSSTGQVIDVYYSHGGGSGNFSLIEVIDCDWADNGASWQYVATGREFTTSTFGAILPTGGVVTVDTCVLKHIPQFAAGSSMVDSSIVPVDVQLTTARGLAGAVSITDNNFDLRDFLGGLSPALWTSSDCDLTFTGNTVRFGATGNKISCPIFKDMASADIVACDNNTYYIGAADIFAKNFDDGGGAVTFLQETSSATDASSYTFSAQNLGAASAGRYIAVCVAARRAGALSIAVSSVTVQGIAATIVANQENNTTSSSVACIAIVAVPTGTTGNVVVTFPLTVLRCAISMFAVTGIDSLTPADTDFSTAAAPTCNLDVPAGGIAIAFACMPASSDTTWTNLTERSDVTLEATRLSAASDAFATAQTGLAITATGSGGVGQDVAVFASWAKKADYTFLEWQTLLGYDASSTRNDP